MLGARHADRDRKAKLRPHAAPDCPGNFGRRTEEMGAARDVGKGLVDRDPLDERREIADHLDGGIAQLLVVLEMAADKSELRTELTRLPSRHAAADPESLGFVRSGKKRQAQPHHRRRWACRATKGRAAARPRHRRHPGLHGGWWLSFPSRPFTPGVSRRFSNL